MADLPFPKRDSGLAARVDDGWVVAYPGEAMYSTVTMYATHMSVNGEWLKLEDDESVVQ